MIKISERITKEFQGKAFEMVKLTVTRKCNGKRQSETVTIAPLEYGMNLFNSLFAEEQSAEKAEEKQRVRDRRESIFKEFYALVGESVLKGTDEQVCKNLKEVLAGLEEVKVETAEA